MKKIQRIKELSSIEEGFFLNIYNRRTNVSHDVFCVRKDFNDVKMERVFFQKAIPPYKIKILKDVPELELYELVCSSDLFCSLNLDDFNVFLYPESTSPDTLEHEVVSTILFFINNDLALLGHITESTLSLIATQGYNLI